MNLFNREKLIFPTIILLTGFVLGGFYYASEVSKQKSIERQQIMKIEEERKAADAKVEQEKRATEAKEQKEEERNRGLRGCLKQADDEYLKYAELNAKEVDEKTGIVTATRAVWDEADKDRKEAKATCFRLYQ